MKKLDYERCTTPKEAKEFLFEVLKEAVKPSEVYAIFYNGKRFRSKSGKIAWNTKQAAKLAIRYTVKTYSYIKDFDSNDVILELENNGKITYEKITEVNGTF